MIERLSGKWVVAVSGGADSMALLDMCRKAKLSIVVATVHYHQRQSADRDLIIVNEYCLKNAIPIYIKHFEEPLVGNFQNQARWYRYSFFKDVVKETGCKGVLTAHHRDDVLETYLWQNQRGHRVKRYGIGKEVEIYGVKIVRPLLDKYKKDLVEYCVNNQIEYGEDESNYSNKYLRNRIRKQLSTKSLEFKIAVFKEMEWKNQQLLMDRAMDKEYAEGLEDIVAKESFLEHERDISVLELWLINQGYSAIMSKKWLKEIVRQLTQVNNGMIPLENDHYLQIHQSTVTLKHILPYEYAITFDKIECVHTPWFTISEQGPRTCALTVGKDDFPITIRNWHPGDSIELRFGTKKISRWFIDRKIPADQRKGWPVICNKDGKVILVPELGCDVVHYSDIPNMFVLK
ncbi:MAG: tRNA lysidine(34) synthetase TilS [Erysipelotrichaceae bacterium]|nr:tRNA lysidine(34) synthetase TilS [Erysipelotrichaceae bacterium]